ncbi:hypothetical protein J6590_077101 [Homalodisca vitripennis]|nr:hypothetical protein J6590_077101 [Homalodisca vitripennis]
MRSYSTVSHLCTGTDPKPSDTDGLPYSSLLYGNGPGHTSPRSIPSNSSTGGLNAVHSAAVPRQWATHGGEDVPVYAQGPLARELFSGTVDQSYIPHAIAYIACLGPHKARCSSSENATRSTVGCTVTESPKSGTAGAGTGAGLVLASSVMSDDNSLVSLSPAPFRCFIISPLILLTLLYAIT